MPTTTTSTSTSPTSPLSRAQLSSFVLPIRTNNNETTLAAVTVAATVTTAASTLSTTTSNLAISTYSNSNNRNSRILQLSNYLNTSLPTMPLPPPSPFANGAYTFKDNVTVSNEFNYSAAPSTSNQSKMINVNTIPISSPLSSSISTASSTINNNSSWLQQQQLQQNTLHALRQQHSLQQQQQQRIVTGETCEQRQEQTEQQSTSCQSQARHRTMSTPTEQCKPFLYTTENQQQQNNFSMFGTTAEAIKSSTLDTNIRICEQNITTTTNASLSTTTSHLHIADESTISAAAIPANHPHVFPTAMLAIATAAPIVVDFANFKLNCVRNNEQHQQQLHMQHFQYIQQQQHRQQQQQQQHQSQQQHFNQQILMLQHQRQQQQQQQLLCQWEAKFNQHYDEQQF